MLTDRDFPAFRDVYLEDSFVVSITETVDSFVIGADLVLLPPHPLRREPREGEVHWWEPSSIVFAPISAVRWVKRTGTVLRDPDGSDDLGDLDSVVETSPGEWTVRGTFGEVVVSSPEPVITHP